MTEQLNDYANGLFSRIGSCLIVSRPWERQIAVFEKGQCVETFHNKKLAKIHCSIVQETRADEALEKGFILSEEHREILKGNMTLDGMMLMNLNANIPHAPTGVWVPLFQDRAEEILTDRLLGID